jgi:hypothetical protein|tara:strand:+ start:56 stop:184 length:129 start_codon:yes stop_codon:yes gene_type:complete
MSTNQNIKDLKNIEDKIQESYGKILASLKGGRKDILSVLDNH